MPVIRSRYPGRCKKCKMAYKPGDRIFWKRGVKGALCFECTKIPTDISPIPESQAFSLPSSDVNVDWTYEISFGELKDRWRDFAARKFQKLAPYSQENQDLLKEMQDRMNQDDNHIDSFYGFNLEQVEKWLSSGYHPAALESVPTEFAPIRKRRKIYASEEGEYQHDAVLSGYDYPFLSWNKRDSLPGIAVNINLNFWAGVKAEVIQDYQTWLCRMLRTLETSGVDCQITIFSLSYNMWLYRPDAITHNRIVVKREDEAMDLTEWSPMLSPAGFRGFIFLNYIISSDTANQTAKNSLGTGLNFKQIDWRIDWNHDTRELTLTPPYKPKDFPEDDMTNRIREILKQARH